MKLTNRVDYFGADISELQNKKLFLFDMDGTIYEEDELFVIKIYSPPIL